MNWNGLKVFLAISQTGSLAGAAKKLCVNHSTVFRRLNAFEEEIGGRLFERFSHRYELTSMGEEVQKLGKEIADSFDTIERHIVGKDFQPTGTIKVTAPINIACRYLPKYLTEFKQLYPDIDIELHAGNQAVNMANRQADIAVRASASPPEHLVGRQVSSIRWSIYASKAYQARFELPATISDLAGHSLIGATGSMRSLPTFSWQEKRYPHQIVARCDELTVMSYFAESGYGLAFLPDDQARPSLIRLFTLKEVAPSALWLLTHPDLRNVERIRLLMRHLSKAFLREPELANLQ